MRRIATAGLVLAIALVALGGGGDRMPEARASARGGGPAKHTPASAVVTATRSSTPEVAQGTRTGPVTLARPRIVERGLCSALGTRDDDGRFVASTDLRTAFVDGNDLLAIVDRSPVGALAADWAPADLVDLETLRPSTVARCEPPGGQCLRVEAAYALVELMTAMRAAGVAGHVHSAFRAYGSQCAVFDKWAHREGQGFCRATEQSALAGHSQHQLGTTLDLFTQAWADAGPVFRSGFGCSTGGRWLAAHAWEHGFVLPYPIHPDRRDASGCSERSDAPHTIDPRTGYRYEPWHLRYLGVANASRFHADWLASEPGSGREITLAQWLRAREARAGDAELPVCDGCSCDACATRDGDGPCGARGLRLGDDGAPQGTPGAPSVMEATAEREGDLVRVRMRVTVPEQLVTQSPTADASLRYDAPGSDFTRVATSTADTVHRFDDLPGAWRLGLDAEGSGRWPVRVGLASRDAAEVWNGADVYLPAASGTRWITVRIAAARALTAVHVALLRDGTARDPISVAVP